MTRCLAGIAASGGSSAPAPGSAATHYDGVADTEASTTFDAGTVAAQGALFSLWVNFGGVVPDTTYLLKPSTRFSNGFTDTAPYVGISFYNAGGKLRVSVDGGKNVSNVASDTYIDRGYPLSLADSAFHHCLAALNFQTGELQLYVDDVVAPPDDGNDFVTGTPFTLNLASNPAFDISATSVYVDGAFFGRAFFFPGCVSEAFCIAFDDAADIPDLSIESNRRKFINADLTPADLGAHGQLPFGVEPFAYFPAGDGVNKGTGGDLTPIGAPSACGSHP